VWVYTQHVAEQLDAATWLDTARELHRLGVRVTLVAAGPRGRQYIGDVEVRCFSKPRLYILGQIIFHLQIVRFIASTWATIDAVLFHHMSAPWLLPLRILRWLKGGQGPLLIMDTRTLPMSVATTRARLRAKYHWLMIRFGNRWADGRTAITGRMAAAAGIPSEKLWGIWTSGVDRDAFARAQASRQWPSDNEPIHLVYVGVLQRERNLLSLVQAVEKANAEGLSFLLSFAGKGPLRPDLEQSAQQTGGRVRVLAPVPHDEVPDLLSAGHVGVLPFPDEEKFRVSSPIKLFEYMASGMPILATRVVCHTDVVEDGRFAFWAEDASAESMLVALRQVWRERSSLDEMGSAAANAADRWTWQESGRNLKEALEHGLAVDSAGLPAVGQPRSSESNG
jgi:glycosyltransferase involved in cell wall biosynthesis